MKTNRAERRRFLQGVSTTLMAGAFAGPAHLSAAAEKQPIKVGQIGAKHAHAMGQLSTILRFADDFEFVGLVESDARQRARIQGQGDLREVRFLTEEQLLSSPNLQAVAVETEVKDLIPTAQRCAEAGLHVFLDKPPGESLGPFRKLVESLASRRRVLQMGYMLRYNPAFVFMFKAIREGWLGEVFSIHAEMSKSVGPGVRQALQEYSGGAMFELGCHLIDPVVAIMGKPHKVSTHILQTRFEDRLAEDRLADNMVAVFDYPRGNVVIRSALNEIGGQSRRQFVAMGDLGTLEIRPLESNRFTLELTRDQGEYKKGRHEVQLPGRARYDGLWADFARAIRQEATLPWDAEHNLITHETVLRASGLPA